MITTAALKTGIKASALALAAFAMTDFATVVDAEAQRAPRGDRNEQPAPAEGRQFSAANGQVVAEAQEQLKANNFAGAISQLNGVLGNDMNAYERSIVHQMLGSAYYEQNNFGQAIQNFESAISAGGLLPNESEALRVNIAQLLIGNGQYARGAQMLEDYLARGGQRKPQYDEYIMQAWVQSENYSRALPYAERWFNSASPKERKHYDLLNFLYNNLGQPGKQADIVKQMINRWPEDKDLWDAWASMLANGGREQEAFEVTKMLYLGGALREQQDLEKVVQYYSFYDMPYQAAEILEKEMQAGRLSRTPERLVQLSNLLRQAREYERAIPVLEQAAGQAGTAKLYADLGEAYYNESQCDKAEAAFKNAVSRGYDAGKSWMLIGTCRYEAAQQQDRPECPTVGPGEAYPSGFYQSSQWYQARQNALEAFRQVPGSSREASAARKWSSFIGDEGENLSQRCEFEATVEQERCFITIQRAYDNSVFSGGFVLDEEDAQCAAYKDDFDAQFRRTVDTDTVRDG